MTDSEQRRISSAQRPLWHRIIDRCITGAVLIGALWALDGGGSPWVVIPAAIAVFAAVTMMDLWLDRRRADAARLPSPTAA